MNIIVYRYTYTLMYTGFSIHIYIYTCIIHVSYTCISIYHIAQKKSRKSENKNYRIPRFESSPHCISHGQWLGGQPIKLKSLQPIHVLRQVFHGKDQPSIGAIVKFLHHAAVMVLLSWPLPKTFTVPHF